MRFAITGLGRSGTMFLAQMLARGDHEVIHEAEGDAIRTPSERRDAFNQRVKPNYGEVSSRLRDVLLDLNVDHRYVILRHPVAIVKSAMLWNRRTQVSVRPLDDVLAIVNDGLCVLDTLIDCGVPFIRFQRMIEEPLVINQLALDLGISLKQRVELADLKRKVNENRRRKLPEPLPKLPELAWFADKYGLNSP
jgi:hypothetical protein